MFFNKFCKFSISSITSPLLFPPSSPFPPFYLCLYPVFCVFSLCVTTVSPFLQFQGGFGRKKKKKEVRRYVTLSNKRTHTRIHTRTTHTHTNN